MVAGHATPANDGVWLFSSTGSWTRAIDVPFGATFYRNLMIRVLEGSGYGNRIIGINSEALVSWTVGSASYPYGNIQDFHGAYSIAPGDGISVGSNLLSVRAGDGLEFASGMLQVKLGANLSFVSGALTATAGSLKYAANVGNGTDTSIVVTHSLGTRDVTVQLYRNGTPWDDAITTIERTSTDTITLTFTTAPAVDAWRVVVMA
jgi:hypothetical protein